MLLLEDLIEVTEVVASAVVCNAVVVDSREM